MSTFPHPFTRNGAEPMLSAVAEYISSVEEPDTGDMTVHTITLILNGQHGAFDLVVEATDMDTMEEHRWEGIAHPTGGVSQFAEVEI